MACNDINNDVGKFDILRGRKSDDLLLTVYIQCAVVSGIFSYMPRWPALSDTVSDSHLDLVKDRNGPDDLEPKTRKQRDAPRVGRADASHERLFPYVELVVRVRQEQGERCVCTPLTAVRGLCRQQENNCLFVKEERR
jgi:hypothetical protein